MPDDIVEALDHNRFRELKVKSLLACNLWLAVNLAAERADASDVRTKIHLLKELGKSTQALVTALGSKDVENG